jgi:hypothetical protein
MSTKLEAMVGLLAGRKVEPELLDELADPSSEASRFLEATRARSRALLAEPGMLEKTKPDRVGRVGLIPLALLASAVLVALALTLLVVERRFQRLETELKARDLESSRVDARRLEAVLERLAESRPSLRPIEDDLARLEQSLAKTPPPKADPALAQARDEIAAIRRELAATDRLASTRSEELQSAIHDASRLLKLLINRLDPPPPDAEPGFKPPPRPLAPGDPRRVKP